jgi:hypothetical protein
VDARNRGHPIGRDRQLRRDLGILRCPALQRKQAHDHLHAVQKPVIGLLAQDLLMLDELVLLTQQSLVPGESLPQPELRAPIFCELEFLARDRAALRASKYRLRKRVRALRRLFNAHFFELSCVRSRLPGHLQHLKRAARVAKLH